MGFGNQVRGLIGWSKTQGWDPTKIAGFTEAEGGDLTQFNHDPGAAAIADSTASYVGKLPQGTPDVFADETAPGVLNPSTPFNVPDAGRENADRRTSGADPNVGGRTG